MGKLASLGSKVATLDLRHVAQLDLTPGATQRLRGRRGVERRSRFLNANPWCAECARQGRKTIAMTPDHIVELADGGADTEANLQPLCKGCHDSKTKASARARAGLPHP